MLDEPRTYRHSPLQFVLVPILVILVGFGFLNSLNRSDYFLYVPFAIIFGFLILSSLYSLSSITSISDAEISSGRLWVTKTMTWADIKSVSGSGYGIKLHNYDGDITVAPSPQLPGYDAVIEMIGQKRPDLFASPEYQEITRNWWSAAPQVVLALAILGFGILNSLRSSDFWLIAFLPVVAGLVMIGSVVFSPQSLTLEGDSLVLRYFFREITYRAAEILSIQMGYQSSRSGKSYFVKLALKNGKSVRISGMKVSVPIMYLALQQWYKKSASSQISV